MLRIQPANVMGSTPRMENRAPASFAVSIDGRIDRNIKPDLCQRADNEIALPIAVPCLIPVLKRAAATNPEMRADRRKAVGACLFDPQQVSPIGPTRPFIDLHRFTRQRVRNVDRTVSAVRDAVAAMTQTNNR
jgi:hypothetical protein